MIRVVHSKEATTDSLARVFYLWHSESSQRLVREYHVTRQSTRHSHPGPEPLAHIFTIVPLCLVFFFQLPLEVQRAVDGKLLQMFQAQAEFPDYPPVEGKEVIRKAVLALNHHFSDRLKTWGRMQIVETAVCAYQYMKWAIAPDMVGD